MREGWKRGFFSRLINPKPVAVMPTERNLNMKRKSLLVALALSCACVFGLIASACSGPMAKTPSLEASITKTFTVGSYNNTTLLVIDLDIKNNSDTNLPGSMVSIYTVATLDGKTLSEGYLSSDNPNALPMTSNIAAKGTGPGQLVFELPATEGTVNVVITVDTTDYSDTVEVLNETIDLADVEAVVSESDYEVVVNGVTVTDDGEGKDLIVLDLTFTNNSNSATSFGYAINAELFQNDIGLKSGYLPYNHPSYNSDLSSNSYTDIKTGASIELQMVFVLLDDTNPVELKLVDSDSYDYAVILEKKIEVSGASGSGSASSGAAA